MKFGIQTWGSRGDVQPLFELGEFLASKGHEVKFRYVSLDGLSWISQCMDSDGFSGPVDKPLAEVLQQVTKSGNVATQMKLMFEHYFDPVLDSMFEQSVELATWADRLLGHSVCHTLDTAADLYQKCRATVHLVPMIPTATKSLFGINLGRVINKWTWSKMDEFSTHQLYSKAQALRAKQGLAPKKSIQKEVYLSPYKNLVLAPRRLTQKPGDWPSNLRVFNRVGTSTTMSCHGVPVGFSEANKGKRVFVSFGSVELRSLRDFLGVLNEVSLALNLDVLIQTSRGNSHLADDIELSSLRFISDYFDHSELLQQCDLFIHHGGAGTTQTAIKSACPSLVVVHGFDQGFWGRWLYEKGLSVKPIKINSVGFRRLKNAVTRLLADKSYRLRARHAADLVNTDLSSDSELEEFLTS
jgi:sterol 3beta-glucosyltransferase